MKVIQPTRQILFDGRLLADIDPSQDVADVVRYHAATEPSLATANIEGPVLSDDGTLATYTISKRLGTKG